METSNLRVCMISAELAPWAKVGGLGDVMASLPGALRKCGVDVTLVMPRYLSVQNRLGPERALHRFPLQMRWGSAGSYDLRIFEARHPDGFCVLLVDCPPLFERAGIYQAPGAPRAYADSLVRWTALCRGALFGALLLGGEWDILHAHDMHAALTLCLVESEYGQTPLAAARRVLSIHNLAYQGIFPLESLVDMGTFAVGESIPALSPFEYYGSLNLMKVGLSYADGIHTVSPTYAYEIVEDEEKGLGLQGMLWSRRHRVMGILNGIDVDVWDPQVQEALVAHYDANNLHGKLKCREALQVELGWEEDDTRPMFGMVTRLTQQKGIELVLGVIPKLQEMGARLVVLGTGEKRFEEEFRRLMDAYPDVLKARLMFDPAMAHRILSGVDMCLMPSLFEPCGLVQMFAMRYGTVPVVRRTGGLADTVDSVEKGDCAGTGFLFDEPSIPALEHCMRHAIRLWSRKDIWHRIQRNGMARDSSWDEAARHYVDWYEQLLKKPAWRI